MNVNKQIIKLIIKLKRLTQGVTNMKSLTKMSLKMKYFSILGLSISLIACKTVPSFKNPWFHPITADPLHTAIWRITI